MVDPSRAGLPSLYASLAGKASVDLAQLGGSVAHSVPMLLREQPGRAAPSCYADLGCDGYFFFALEAALFRLSFTLSFTIWLIRSKGTGLSRGNLTVLFAAL